jgi:hypothetical protein
MPDHRGEKLKEHVQAAVENFFTHHQPQESCLVLDSTGMAATKHYLVLAAIGLERLGQFREIHAFSGGAFAYFGFHGLIEGKTNYSLPTLAAGRTEAAIRRLHHPNVLGPVRALYSFLLNKTAFGTSVPLAEMVNFIFSPEHLERRLQDFPSNIKIYLGVKGAEAPIGVSRETLSQLGESGARLQDLPVRDLMVLSSKVPFVYGLKDKSDEFFDAAFTRGYKSALKSIVRKNRPTLVSTPWREGNRGNVTYLNCYGHKHQKRQMRMDFAKLLLNLPNHGWGRDISAAFL